MAVSKTDIWNAALGRVGENDQIEDENDTGDAADDCRLHYDRCRKMVLTQLLWPFAKHQKVLQRLGATRFGWSYVYALPADCLEPRCLVSGDTRYSLLSVDQRTPFDVMSNDAGDGRILCCDLAPADFDVLEYTRDLEAVTTFDPHFENALAWRMAGELALSLKRDRALYREIMEFPRAGFPGGHYWQAISVAGAQAQRGRQADPDPETPSIAARS